MSTIEIVLDEIKSVLAQVKEEDLSEIVNQIGSQDRIFVDGEGRSGLMGKGFAMRLMHIGYKVYVVGETITPSIKQGDVYISISGSGETKYVVSNAQRAKEIGCKIISITSKKESSLGKLGDALLLVPGTTKSDTGEARKSVQLLSSLFDQSVHIVLDCLCLLLSERDQISNEMAIKKHSNLE